MKNKQSLRLLLRTPLKTTLTLLLLAALTATLFVKANEYGVVRREKKRLIDSYDGVATASVEYPHSITFNDAGFCFYFWFDYHDFLQTYIGEEEISREEYIARTTPQFIPLELTEDIQSAVADAPEVTSTHTRYLTAGISADMTRLPDEEFYNYTARTVFEATIDGVVIKDDGWSNSLINVKDMKLLAGNPDWFYSDRFAVNAWPEKGSGCDTLANSQVSLVACDYPYDNDYYRTLVEGDRYIFVCRANLSNFGKHLGDYFAEMNTTDYWPPLTRLDGTEDFDSEEFAPLRKLIEVTNQDIHTFDVVYCDSTAAIPHFQDGTIQIMEGRGLRPEDDGKDVCLVSTDLAETYGLQIGDRIPLSLCDKLFHQNAALGAVSSIPERFSTPVKEDEFEIVGFYSILAPRADVCFDTWKYYSINTFFVPLSHLPVSEAEAEAFPKLPGDWNAIIGDVRQVESYEAGLAERLAVLNEGRTVTVWDKDVPVTVNVEVSDGNWHEVAENLQRAEVMALLSLGALVLAVLAASALVAYLFLGRKKKEYAIQRALGVPVKDANRSLLLPFCVLVLAATVIGGIAALLYSRGTVASGLTELAAEGAVDTRISGWALLLSIVGELAAVGLFALLWVRRIAHLPPLTLLQEK